MTCEKVSLTQQRLIRRREKHAKQAIFDKARDDLLDAVGMERRDKNQARCIGLVSEAMQAGLLPRLSGDIKCSDCDNPAWAYDHRSYARPLDVQPVCRRCNSLRGYAEDSLAKMRHELYVKAGLVCIKNFHVTPQQIHDELAASDSEFRTYMARLAR